MGAISCFGTSAGGLLLFRPMTDNGYGDNHLGDISEMGFRNQLSKKIEAVQVFVGAADLGGAGASLGGRRERSGGRATVFSDKVTVRGIE